MTQHQREALLDLLVLSIFVDSYLSLAEDAALHQAMEELGWEAELPRDIFFLNSMNRARQVSASDEKTAEYVKARAAAFTDATFQQYALEQLERVLASDTIVPSESAFLNHVRDALPKLEQEQPAPTESPAA